MKDFIIRYWLQLLFTLIVTGVGYSLKTQMKKIKDYMKGIECDRQEQQVLKRVMLSILRDRLFQECTRLLKKRKITMEEIDNITCLYTEYHDELGGNGSIAELYKRCLNMEIE